jgi:hypothetical protein
LLCLKTFNAAYHGKQSNGKNWVAGNLCSSWQYEQPHVQSSKPVVLLHDLCLAMELGFCLYSWIKFHETLSMKKKQQTGFPDPQNFFLSFSENKVACILC